MLDVCSLMSQCPRLDAIMMGRRPGQWPDLGGPSHDLSRNASVLSRPHAKVFPVLSQLLALFFGDVLFRHRAWSSATL